MQLAEQQRAQPLRHRARDLEPDSRGRPLPIPQHQFQSDEEIVRLVDLDLDVGVARDPERVVLDQRHPGEQLIEVGGDHLLDRHEPPSAGELEEPRQQRRDLHPREAADAAVRVADDDRKVERQIADVRERVRRIDRERGENGEDPFLEHLLKLAR